MKDTHLVVLVHGLWGSPAHLVAAKQELEMAWDAQVSQKRTSKTGPTEDPTISTILESEQERLVIMVAGGMTSQLTYDGIDVCASRVAFEIDERIARLMDAGKRVTRFSVTGYSLGGLVARYLIGLLQARDPCFFDLYTPYSFSTIATPHLGITRYNTFLSTVLCWLGARLLSRSGEQLYVADQYSEQDPRPLLEIMADPSRVFLQALSRFEKINIFANGVNDNTVPYPSSAIEMVDHFAEWEKQGLEVDADDADIIRSWSKPSTVPTRPKTWGVSFGTLPPVLRYRFPLNYVRLQRSRLRLNIQIIILLFPIMFPLVVILMYVVDQGFADPSGWLGYPLTLGDRNDDYKSLLRLDPLKPVTNHPRPASRRLPDFQFKAYATPSVESSAASSLISSQLWMLPTEESCIHPLPPNLRRSHSKCE
ncbi:putative serine esterase-domain-containing protein [Naematelia encephala]|uniref:Putative serine esterase-domain-containing protein n=1 Tax=Naematelia encephala TaxID=71784 RepID=A0A1Y2AYZ7_9TREE|nr:putative serine esterase-domain-containing protein [Naematelia encephala]